MNRKNQAMRLTFSYEGDDVQLVSQQSVTMVPPPSDTTENFAARSGFWVELRDAGGGTLHRQVMHNPIRTDREVFSNDAQHTIRRAEVPNPKGVFTVVVPDLAGADTLSLFSSPREGATRGLASHEPAREIKTFKLERK